MKKPQLFEATSLVRGQYTPEEALIVLLTPRAYTAFCEFVADGGWRSADREAQMLRGTMVFANLPFATTIPWVQQKLTTAALKVGEGMRELVDVVEFNAPFTVPLGEYAGAQRQIDMGFGPRLDVLAIVVSAACEYAVDAAAGSRTLATQ